MSERGKSGIYSITHRVSGKRYVGQAASIGDRWLTHRSHLKLGRHHCQHLQSAWNKYGPDSFAFEVLEYVPADKDQLREREQFHMDQGCHYNIAPAAGSLLGWKRGPHSPETISKIKASRAGFKHSTETIEKLKAISDQKRADGTMYRPTAEHLDALRKANTGKERKPETVEKWRSSRAGYRPTPETIAKQAASNTGKKRTPEQCARIAEANRGHGIGTKQAPEWIESRIAPLRGRKRPEALIAAHDALRRLRQPTIDAIKAALLENPRINQTLLATELGCGRGTIRKYMREMFAGSEDGSR